MRRGVSVLTAARRYASEIASLKPKLELQFPAALPVTAHREEIARAITDNQVIILCGETGSGKTTQLPKICLDIGRGSAGLIGHTQPRRLAARTVAARLAEETGTRPGEHFAYKIRFTDQTGPNCRVKLMTDGILLQEMVQDREFRKYDTLIIDEAHERSINIDFLLGYLRTLLPRRPDLRLIITSATIDPQSFSKHFCDAPVIEVSGRTFPVEVRYRPPGTDGDQIAGILDGIAELRTDATVGRGDILVFLPGERDIRDATKAVRQRFGPSLEVLPLFARLATHEQDKIYAPGPKQRVVLATNVAETSLTVPRIASVIDTGLARISRYSHHSKIQQLPIEAIARASADQRKGRCGRLGPGVCLRLYAAEDFESRAEYVDPEIVRTSLAGVLLRMEVLELGDIEGFPFLDSPDRRMIRDAQRLLHELGALDGETLTPLGRRLAGLSVDPRIGRMLLAAGDHDCLREMLVVASALSIPDPQSRTTPTADDEPVPWHDSKSDFNGFLKLWDHFHTQQRELSGNQLRKWCRETGLAFMRMREWQDLHRQLRQQCHRLRLRANKQPATSAAVHRAILTGLLSHIGERTETKEYRGARGLKFRLSPGSAVRANPPRWLVAASIVQTHHTYAANVAAVKAKWIESAGAHLVRRSYSEPCWDTRRRQVVARETVSLYGLILSARRSVAYAAIDPSAARRVFIREGLVAGGYRLKGAAARHNLQLAAQLGETAARLRRGDVMPDSVSQARFYESLLPADCTGPAPFEAWRTVAEKDNPRLLYMTFEDLTAAQHFTWHQADYPDELESGANRYPLRYRHAPGEMDDGVTVIVPAAAAKTMEQRQLDWLVPGMLAEKVATVVRGLPKSLRRRLVPAPQRAAEFLQSQYNNADGLFYEQLAIFLTRAAGQTISAADCAQVVLPDYLNLRIEFVDSDGKMLAAGRDLTGTVAGLGAELYDALALAAADEWHRHGIRQWDFGSLPKSVTVQRQGVSLLAYPGLEDRGDSVNLRLYDEPGPAARATRRGIVRLLALRLPQQSKMIADRLRRAPNIALLSRRAGGLDLLCDQAVVAVIDSSMLGDRLPQDADSFSSVAEAGRADVVQAGEAFADKLVDILAASHALGVSLDDVDTGTAADIRQHLEHLVFPGFVSVIPREWLQEYPRYLKAISRRIESLRQGGADRDRRNQRDIDVYWDRWLSLEAAGGLAVFHDEAAMQFRFMIEEYRVSLFAQQLGTRVRVSPKRLEELWQDLSPRSN